MLAFLTGTLHGPVVNAFQVNRRKKWVGRLVFYSIVALTFHVVGELVPTEADLQFERDRDLGVGIPLYGVPIEEMARPMSARIYSWF